MKKISIVVFLVCCSTCIGYSQGFNWGLKAGLNIASQNVSGSSYATTDTKTRICYHAGAYFTYMFSESLGLQPEVLYNSVGSSVTLPASVVAIPKTEIARYNYLSMPILLKYYPVKIVNIQLGPQVSYLIYADSKQDNNTTSTISSSYTSPFELSAVIGAGFDLPLNLDISLRYYMGLTNAIRDNSYGGKIINNVFQLSVGYRFNQK